MPLFPCPECGHQISTTALMCPSCGAPVQKAVQVVEVTPTKDRPFGVWFWMLVALILLIGGCNIIQLVNYRNATHEAMSKS